MKCRAKEMGFVNGSRVRQGQEFEADVCPKWAEPAERPAPVKKKEKPAPATLSELNKAAKEDEQALWENRHESSDATDLG